MPIQTETIVTDQAEPATTSEQLASATHRFVMLTEPYGEFETKRRSVWVNPSLVTHVAEYLPWRREGEKPVRHSFIHFGGDNTLHVEEGPIYVAFALQEALV